MGNFELKLEGKIPIAESIKSVVNIIIMLYYLFQVYNSNTAIITATYCYFFFEQNEEQFFQTFNVH